jgi:hypothetical protein
VDLDGAVYRGLTGQRRNKQTPRGIMKDAKDAFGTWKEVARQSGISERTLRRLRAPGKWTASRATRQKLDQLGQQQPVRDAGIKPGKRRKLNQAQRRGARIKIDAKQGPIGAGAGDYRRPRIVDFHVPAADVGRLVAAYEQGNDAAIRDILGDLVTDYGWTDWTPPGGWGFDNIYDFDVEAD